MKKSIAIVAAVAVAVAVAVAGCSHNVVNYSDGVGFETTMRPDTGNFGFTFRYGKILTATVRENTEVEMTGNADAATKDTVSTATAGGVKIKVGKQITGYYVDALEAGATAEQLAEYASQ
jgi:predicted small secreted protein